MAARMKIGELVSYVEGTGREVAGLVVEVRRADCRVLNLDSEESYWLPRPGLRRGARSIRKGSLTSLLSSLVLHLEARELELERSAEGGVRAQIGCRALDAAEIEEIRRYFGAGLRSLRIEPGGMAKLHLVLEITASGEKPPSK